MAKAVVGGSHLDRQVTMMSKGKGGMPSQTGNPSGGGRDNNPPSKK